MNTYTRGIRNAFRNQVRTLSIVVILGLSIGLSLAMLVAHQAVGQKITSVKSSIGNTITVEPAGFGGGFGGGGNALTASELSPITKLTHVTGVSETLTDRLTNGTDTSLQSAISLGNLGKRFAGAGELFGGGAGGGFGPSGGSSSSTTVRPTFTATVTAVGTTDPTSLSTTGAGGSTASFALKSGKVFNGNSTADVAIVGTSLATKNNLKIGSTFTAYGKTITVIGIFDGGSTFVNDEAILPLATEQTLSGQTGDVSSATVTVDSISNLSSTTSAIQKKLGTSKADVTDNVAQAQEEVQPLQDVSSISLYSLIGAVVAGGVIVFLTMIMIVRERRREIGIFKAIGASNLKVMLQFMSEAVTLTLMGAVVGIILGVVAGNPITKLLVNNSSSSSTSTTSGGFAGEPGGAVGGGVTTHHAGGGGFGFVGHNVTNIHATVGYSIILYGLLAAIVIALIGSAAVSFLISNIRPAEVMRSE